MNKIPKIGIVGWSTGDNSFGTTKAYLHYLAYFNADIRILTPKADIDEDLDLVIMPGGKDTLPMRYGQVPGYYNSDPDQFKEHFAMVNLPQYIEVGIPIFGICLGFQMLCVHFGLELDQEIDIATHGYSDEKLKGRGELVNDLIFTMDYIPVETRLSRKKKIKVCSLHHQGVLKDEFEKENCPLNLIAHTSDGISEFMEHRELPIAACQGHPEEDFNPLSIYLIKNLLKRSPNLKNETPRNFAAAQD